MVNFLVQLLNAGPGSHVVLCQASPIARRVVAALPLPARLSLRPDLPAVWVDPRSAPRATGTEDDMRL